MSLYIAWSMVYQRKTVIYEIFEDGIVYVISPNGCIRVVAVLAPQVNVPELRDIGAVHIYDAKAESRLEPAGSPAFPIKLSSDPATTTTMSSTWYGTILCPYL